MKLRVMIESVIYFANEMYSVPKVFDLGRTLKMGLVRCSCDIMIPIMPGRDSRSAASTGSASASRPWRMALSGSAHGGYDGITPYQHPMLGVAGPDGSLSRLRIQRHWISEIAPADGLCMSGIEFYMASPRRLIFRSIRLSGLKKENQSLANIRIAGYLEIMELNHIIASFEKQSHPSCN